MPIHWKVQHVSNTGVYAYEMHGVNEDLSQVKLVVNSRWSNQNSLKINATFRFHLEVHTQLMHSQGLTPPQSNILGQVVNVRYAVLCFHWYFAAYDVWHKEGT